MKPSEFKALIISRFKASLKRSLLVESSPGIGKTEICKQAAAELNVGFKMIHAPLMQPEDYGMPVVSGKDRDSLKFIVSADKFPLENSDCPETGIFLIDEISQADNSAQKILANLIQEREIHGHKLKKGWYIVATGNRVKDRAGANRLLTQLGNRATRVPLEVSLDDWTQWALTNGVKPEVIAFIRFKPALLSNFDPNQDVNATPRAWAEGVSAALGAIDKALEFPVFTGDVGEGPAAEFMSFLKTYRDLPNPDAILLDPKNSAVPKEASTQYAVVGALVHRVTAQNFGRALTYIKRLPPEFSVLFIKDAIVKCRDIQTTKEFIDWASKEGAALLT